MESSQVDTNKYYDILMVPKTATPEEIKESYEKLVKQNQPEEGGDTEKIDLINKAYDILKDPGNRELYDRYGERLAPNEESNPWRTVDTNAVQNQFSNLGINYQPIYNQPTIPARPPAQPQSLNKKTSPLIIHIDATLEDTLGTTKTIEVLRKLVSPNFDQQTAQKCAYCDGSGKTVTVDREKYGHDDRITRECNFCYGAGFPDAYIKEKQTLDIEIPKGSCKHTCIKIEGKGNHEIG